MHSDAVELEHGDICYRRDDTLLWELAVSAVRVIGEASNQNGPFLDDYFLCFATDPDCWYEVSFDAEGRKEFLKSLETLLGYELDLKLILSTDFKSNVLWPPHLAGTPMFSFSPAQPKTWVEHLIGPLEMAQRFSDEVLAELRD